MKIYKTKGYNKPGCFARFYDEQDKIDAVRTKNAKRKKINSDELAETLFNMIYK